MNLKAFCVLELVVLNGTMPHASSYIYITMTFVLRFLYIGIIYIISETAWSRPRHRDDMCG